MKDAARTDRYDRAQDQRVCHLASTMEILPDDRSSRIGFRLVYDHCED